MSKRQIVVSFPYLEDYYIPEAIEKITKCTEALGIAVVLLDDEGREKLVNYSLDLLKEQERLTQKRYDRWKEGIKEKLFNEVNKRV